MCAKIRLNFLVAIAASAHLSDSAVATALVTLEHKRNGHAPLTRALS
jgi:hypothetical protein